MPGDSTFHKKQQRIRLQWRIVALVAFLFAAPVVAGVFADLDGDGIPDDVEGYPPQGGQTHRLLNDTDGDGLSDSAEDRNANGQVDVGETDPRQSDSDGDSLEDGIEVWVFYADPLNPASPGTASDADGDRLPIPYDLFDGDADADDDRFLDGYEAAHIGVGASLNPLTIPELGDLNLDGNVSNLDALLAQALFLWTVDPGAAVFTGRGFRHADPNRDGQITNLDALLCQVYFQGAVPYLPLLENPPPPPTVTPTRPATHTPSPTLSPTRTWTAAPTNTATRTPTRPVYGGRFRDNLDGTITDVETGLVWAKNDVRTPVPWSAAQEYARNVTIAGYADWKIPDMAEVKGIPGFSLYEALDVIAGPWPNDHRVAPFNWSDTADQGYWSSTWAEWGHGQDGYLCAGFLSGLVWSGRAENERYFLRLVRRCPCEPAPGATIYGGRFADNHDGTILDMTVGILWARADNGQAVPWNSVVSWVRDLRIAGRGGWRLPKWEELHDALYDGLQVLQPGPDRRVAPFLWSPGADLYWADATCDYGHGNIQRSALTFSNGLFNCVHTGSSQYGYIRAVHPCPCR